MSFAGFAHATARAVGSPWAFTAALVVVVAWAASGPLFHYSDTWQLVINTSTTIVTFMVVFLIQNTQNRDGRAIQLKLDELLRVTERAHNSLIGIERRQTGVQAMLGVILVVVLLFVLLGGGVYGHSAGWYAGPHAYWGGGLGLLLVIVLVLYLLGVFR